MTDEHTGVRLKLEHEQEEEERKGEKKGGKDERIIRKGLIYFPFPIQIYKVKGSVGERRVAPLLKGLRL